MVRTQRWTALPAAAAIAALCVGTLGFSIPAAAQDATPPAATPGKDHRNDPAWQACKKQADDQKLERGEARRDFMKNCMKTAKSAKPAAP